MKFIKAIFENEDIKNLAVSNEELANEAASSVVRHNLFLEDAIQVALPSYLIEEDLATTYQTIVDDVVSENIQMINLSSHILASDFSNEEKLDMLKEAEEEAKKSFYQRHKKKIMAGAAAAGAGGLYVAARTGKLGTGAQDWVKGKEGQAKNLFNKGKESASKAVNSAKESASKAVDSAKKTTAKFTGGSAPSAPTQVKDMVTKAKEAPTNKVEIAKAAVSKAKENVGKAQDNAKKASDASSLMRSSMRNPPKMMDAIKKDASNLKSKADVLKAKGNEVKSKAASFIERNRGPW